MTYGFQALVDGVWTATAAGEQDGSNYLATREAAEAELEDLAACLDCSLDEVRVVEVPK